MSENLLEIRKKLRKKRPSFHREDSHKVKGIKRAWRKPTGRHSKVRHQRRGYVMRVEPGYGSPAVIRGSHKSGLFPVIVHNIADFKGLDKSKQGIVIASRVGKKNKVKKKDETKEKKKKTEEKKPKLAEKVEQEDKKKQEKKKLDKALTKRQK
jgi:large subunit ribosomal protein L32e